MRALRAQHERETARLNAKIATLERERAEAERELHAERERAARRVRVGNDPTWRREAETLRRQLRERDEKLLHLKATIRGLEKKFVELQAEHMGDRKVLQQRTDNAVEHTDKRVQHLEEKLGALSGELRMKDEVRLARMTMGRLCTNGMSCMSWWGRGDEGEWGPSAEVSGALSPWPLPSHA